MLYRQIPTLQEYILISSMEPISEKFMREPSGSWILTNYKDMNAIIRLDTIDHQTTLAEFYREVVFEKDDTISGKGMVRDWG